MLHTPITADWTQDVRAQRVLSSFAAHPPVEITIPAMERWSRADRCYAGYRTQVLAAIRDEHGDKLLEQCDRTGDYAPFALFLEQPSIDDAVRAAMSPSALTDLVHSAARGIAA